MSLFDNNIYHKLIKITNYVLLNIIWLIMCVPLITVFPATAALFSVVRKWQKSDTLSLFSDFMGSFKEHFKDFFLIGLVWSLLGVILVVDLYFFFNIDALWSHPVLFITGILSVLYLFTTLYIFPAAVHFTMRRWTDIIKNAFLFSLLRLELTLLCLMLLLIYLFLVYVYPLTLILMTSFVVHLIFRITLRVFHKIENNYNKS